MPTGRMLLATVVCLLVFGTCPLLYGQATGIISGTVTDATGSAVAGAKVVATAPALGVIRDSTTDDSGHFLVPLLPVANYSVHVDKVPRQNILPCSNSKTKSCLSVTAPSRNARCPFWSS